MKAIVAMDPARVIGYKGRIPWHYSEDMKFFKQITGTQNLFMGRSTYDSIGKPLPNRFTYILTNDPAKLAHPAGIRSHYITGNQFMDWLRTHPHKMESSFLCGGANVFKQFLPFCTEIYVTHIADEYEGDTYMPEFESMFPDPSIVLETKDFIIARYQKKLKRVTNGLGVECWL